ncbi:hypothetical protein WME79_45920 [Sorangium sp. So ce726]|uniref:hypothetical protein n=1 Tax=Sorangium sp. So ce726 TaxID=3133319 RepID=UPI003F5F306B
MNACPALGRIHDEAFQWSTRRPPTRARAIIIFRGHEQARARDLQEDLATKFAVLVGYVQHGIDISSVDRIGASLFRGGGGKLFAYAFKMTF